MCTTRSEKFRKKGILSVVLYSDLGLCVEFGDEKVDNEIYGYGPTQGFITAVAREIKFQIRNTGDLERHPTLRKVYRRFQEGKERLSLEGQADR